MLMRARVPRQPFFCARTTRARVCTAAATASSGRARTDDVRRCLTHPHSKSIEALNARCSRSHACAIAAPYVNITHARCARARTLRTGSHYICSAWTIVHTHTRVRIGYTILPIASRAPIARRSHGARTRPSRSAAATARLV